VHAKQNPLLSGKASKALGLIERIHEVKLQEKFPKLKESTGTLPGVYSLKINPKVPPVVHGPRRQPRALTDKIVAKLKEMQKASHIAPVTTPTDWVSSMVSVVKKGILERICIDPRDLNQAIQREHYPIPTVEEVVASFPNATTFSVLDAKTGFLQILLDYESSLLTTFNTPIGRFRWLRLPQGIKSAPEIYQRIMDKILENTGARAVMDDILIAGSEKEHDEILERVVKRAQENNLVLNFDKCQIRKNKVKFCGHIISENGLSPDPQKVKAITNMPTPQNKEDVRRFLGMVQYLSKFLPNKSTIDAPLRSLIKKDVEFHWDKPQQKSFEELKQMCTSAPLLAIYDPKKEHTIQCDASGQGLGGVLLQEGKPVAYTSRALRDPETRYWPIELETLAIVHSCKKFHYYSYGKAVTVDSDHKPLQAIFSKPLLAAPVRLQSFMLELQPYDITVRYAKVPIGDALSRASLKDSTPDMEYVHVNMIDYIAVSNSRYQQFQQKTADELNELHQIIKMGWPDTKNETPHSVREYWTIRDELAILDGIVYRGMRIVVPPSLRKEMLMQIHETHQGITKCKQRARKSLYWPGMSGQIEELIKDCDACNTFQNKQHSESLIPTKTPSIPWNKIASDIFHWEDKNYLLTVDYFSKFIEVDELADMTSSTTIQVLKSQICRHGIPQFIRTDNGTQFASGEFNDFLKSYNIQLDTSSPGLAQSNGEAERAVQTVKRLWCKNTDKHLALLDYRSTPLESCGLSPAQLLNSRRFRTKLPIASELLKPKSYDLKEIQGKLDKSKNKQKLNYDRKAGQDLEVLLPGDPIRMAPLPGSKQWIPGRVVGHHNSPRSYIVECKGRRYRRNRRFLRLSTYADYQHYKNKQPTTCPGPEVTNVPVPQTPEAPNQSNPPVNPPPNPPPNNPKSPVKQNPPTPKSVSRPSTSSTEIRTRYGRVVKPPTRLDL
jgi:hypothetical protein